MNYIKKLECDLIESNSRVIDLLERIEEFHQHLAISKFDHPNNYINKEDVLRWLRYIETGRN